MPADAQPASRTRSPEPSPFVPLAPHHRALLVAGLYGYLTIVGVLAYFLGVSTTAWVFLALALKIVLLSLPLLFHRSEFGWVHPVILHVLLVFVVFHLVRTPLYVWGMEYHLALPDWSREELAGLVAWELVLGSLALAAYYLGFFSGVRPRLPRLHFRRPRGVRWKALAVVVLAAVVFFLYVRSQGGIVRHLLSWVELGRVDAVRGEGHWLKLSRFGGLAALVWFAFDRSALRRPLFWGAASVTLAINFLGSGSRSAVVFLVVVGTLIWMLRRRRVFPVRGLMVVTLCLLLLASLGRLRRSLFHGEVEWRTLYSAGAVDSFRSVVDELLYRYGTLDSSYAVLARVPGEEDFLYGRSYLTLLALPVPRFLWPEKPGTVGKVAGEVFYGVKAGVPPGAVGEAYWNFHLPGVLALFVLFGVFHRFLADFYLRYRGEPAAAVLFAVTVFWVQPSINAAAEWIYTTASVALLLVLFGAVRTTRRREAVAAADLGARRAS